MPFYVLAGAGEAVRQAEDSLDRRATAAVSGHRKVVATEKAV